MLTVGSLAASMIGHTPLGGAYNANDWLRADGVPLTYLEERKALLECGSLLLNWLPEGHKPIYRQVLGVTTDDENLNHGFMVDGCMERSGFKSRLQQSLKKTCGLYPRYATFPACQPGAIFPERNVERRLNSWYCKVTTDREYCLKHAVPPITSSSCLTEREECIKRSPFLKTPIEMCNNLSSDKMRLRPECLP